MDVKLTKQSACFFSFALLLSLGGVSLSAADEAIATDAEESSMIFISDDTTNEPPSLPQSVVGASAEGSLVFIEDTPKSSAQATLQQAAAAPLPVFIEPAQSIARGELKVISNQATQVHLEALRPMLKQQPLAPIVQQPLAATTTIHEPRSAPHERDQPGDIQVAVHNELVSAPSPVSFPARPTIKPFEELLISAHQQSLLAESMEDYTQIIESCAEALHQFANADKGTHADKRQFAHRLSSWALNRRGQLSSDESEQDLAYADFQTALDYNPRNWRAMHNRGVSFAQLGQFAEAFDDFNAVVQLNPKYAKAYANRATLYVQAKDLQSATKDYKLAIQQDSQFATAYVGLGRVCHMLGRWDDAIENFTAAIQLEPTSPNIVCSRGDLQADMGNYADALADYARTIELDPEFAHAYRNGAWLLATCPDERYRDPENAVLGAQQALEYSYGDRHIALDTLAAALASNGQFEEAVATVAQAVETAPEDAKIMYLSRLELYQAHEPFRSVPVGDVTQATYEANSP